MAKLLPNFMFLGSMANVSAYKRIGSDKIILRTKGGPSKQKIKRSPVFEETRKNNKEFGGRSTTSEWFMTAFIYLDRVADYNVAGSLNGLLKPIQELDTENEKGKRNVLISRNPKLLEGFNLNKRHSFDSMIRNTVEWSISRENRSAQIKFPALMPGINFTLPDGQYPVYRFAVVLLIIPDMLYQEKRIKYQPFGGMEIHKQAFMHSEWFSVSAGSPVQQIQLQLPVTDLPAGHNLMLAATLSFGKFNAMGTAEPVKYVGCGKIVGMA